MTRNEFEQRYTKGSNVMLNILRQHGRYAIPCNCGDTTCVGWQMASLLYGEPGEIEQIVSDYPEAAERVNPVMVESYKAAAEVNRKYA